jgi:F0F1-type ATP synthase membrane subunit b/b'
MVDGVSPETAASLHLKNGGAAITTVDQDGPACRAGLQSGDIVVAFNGKPVTNPEQFASLIHSSAPGSSVTMTVVRNGQNKDMKVTLGDWKQMAGMPPKAPLNPVGAMPYMPPPPPMPPHVYPEIDIPSGTTISARQGIVVEPLSPQLCDFFGVPQNRGVLVRSVDKGSPGAMAGLKAGDVIVKVNNETIHDIADWRRTLRSQGGKVSFSIVRDKKEQVIQISLPANTSEWRDMDGDGFGIDASMLAISSDQLDEIRRQAESAAKSVTPEMQKQMESFRLQGEEIRRQAESATKCLGPEIKKQTEEWSKQSLEMSKQTEQMRKEIETMAPEIAKNAREMAESMKPSAKEIEEMTRDIQKQWKEQQPEFQKQMDELKREIEKQQREWLEMYKENKFKPEF